MRNAWTIARRELQFYFASPIGYIVLAMFAVIFGYHFVTFLLTFAQYSGQMGLQLLNHSKAIQDASLVHPSTIA